MTSHHFKTTRVKMELLMVLVPTSTYFLNRHWRYHHPIYNQGCNQGFILISAISLSPLSQAIFHSLRFFLHNNSEIWSLLSIHTTKTLVHAIIPCLSDCSVFSSAHDKYSLVLLLSVKNAASKFIFPTHCFGQVTLPSCSQSLASFSLLCHLSLLSKSLKTHPQAT